MKEKYYTFETLNSLTSSTFLQKHQNQDDIETNDIYGYNIYSMSLLDSKEDLQIPIIYNCPGIINSIRNKIVTKINNL